MLLKRLFWTAYLAYHARGQARYAFRSAEAIGRDQARRLRRMVAYAHRHVPHYREAMGRLGLQPADFRTAADLARLPLVGRDELQRDPERFVSETVDVRGCLRLRSAGTTGRPVTVYRTPAAVLQDAAHGERLRSAVARVVGRGLRYRETTIIAPVSSVADVRRFWQDRCLLPRGLPARPQRLSVLDPPEANVPLLDAFRPDVISSYGSYLELLFGWLREAGQPHHRPTAVIYGADELPEPIRRLLLDESRIHVFSAYQAIEAYFIGFECERHRGLHLNTDLYPVRIVDAEGRALPPGEAGEVVVSNLVNDGTVLLNYRLGDVATLLPESCPCGRRLPLLALHEGRRDDFIVAPSGQRLHPHVVNDLLRFETQLLRYRVVQETLTTFRVAIVPAASCDREAMRQRLAARFAEAFGAGVEARIEFVDAIPPTPAGKHRPVVSLVARPGAAR